ncbi:hypothetical protein PG999_004002 [Apiospora kogelbergensis]|uniref:Uncharacterized protein n=1 Tax=Apiospora kogelbergensis TaxID=1337665 RepID=A0AAW0R559_9PEZI
MSQELGAGSYYPHLSIAETMGSSGQPGSSDETPGGATPPEPIVIDDNPYTGELTDTGFNNARAESDNVFLVRFRHLECPGDKACDPWHAVDLGHILRYLCRPLTDADTEPPTAKTRRRRKFEEVLDRAFGAGADLALRLMHHPRGGLVRTSEPDDGGATLTYVSEALIKSARICWAGVGGHLPVDGRQYSPARGFGLSANLYDLDDVRTVQQQLELVRRRGYRDWIEVEYETCPGGFGGYDGNNSGSHEKGEGDEGNTTISMSLGGSSDGHGGGGGLGHFVRQSQSSEDHVHDDDGDAQMDSPPWSESAGRCPPSSPDGKEDGGMNTQVDTGYKGDILDLEQLREPLFGTGKSPTPSSSAAGPSSQHQEQEQGRERGQKQGKEAGSYDDGFSGPDSQGQIW